MQNGQSLNLKQLASIFNSNETSAREYQVSKINGIIGLSSIVCNTIFIGVGFYNIVKAAQATNENDLVGSTDYSNKSTANMLVGAGFYLLSVPFNLMSNSHFNKSIKLYNSSQNTGSINNVDMYLGFTDNSIGAKI